MSAEITDQDKTNCESIGKSISDIIRFSLDDDFRRHAFKLFGVSSTKDVENEISKRLITMIKNRNAGSKKKGDKSSKDEEKLQEQNDTSEEKEEDDSSTSTDSESESNSQRNWLQISSEQYMKAVKRKKFNFFSQPQFSKKDFEFSNCNAHSSHSQPLPHASSSYSFYNRAMSTSSEPPDDGINFCRKRFQESFQENACKYLKSNSKSQVHKRFS